MGALIVQVMPGAAQKAGIAPGDVIIEYNGRPVANRDELVKMVVGTKPGTTVPVKILRDKKEQTLNVTVDELDLEAERQSQRTSRDGQNEPPETQGSGFGLTLGNLTPQMSRRLQLPSGQTGALITEVDPDGPAAGALRAGDVILSVNRKRVSNANDAARELQAIPSGRLAQILVWRGDGEVFVTVKKD
jgi:serine protease Do